MSRMLDNLAALVDDDLCIGCESAAAESEYSRLAHECHRLRIENQRMREALDAINRAVETTKGKS